MLSALASRIGDPISETACAESFQNLLASGGLTLICLVISLT
jgi:hypothetical protein